MSIVARGGRYGRHTGGTTHWSIVALCIGVVLMVAVVMTADRAPAAEATPDVVDDGAVTLSGCGESKTVTLGYWPRTAGKASWYVSCSNGRVRISGWHKDLRSDGKCVQVYGSVSGSWFSTPKACPEGERESWSRYRYGTGTIKVYARLV
ncbi:hypothetical protein [Haloglycomyces albus]|uniref:hypothetical protein n=1 Tax=Haloglycomyces albus TaxID=526067 RepID=UPI0004BA43B9|nr:hypothetical protein [Haloglycomyces albus]